MFGGTNNFTEILLGNSTVKGLQTKSIIFTHEYSWGKEHFFEGGKSFLFFNLKTWAWCQGTSWEFAFYPQVCGQELSRHGEGFRKPQSLPKNFSSWGPSLQIYELMDAILIQIPTVIVWDALHLNFTTKALKRAPRQMGVRVGEATHLN